MSQTLFFFSTRRGRAAFAHPSAERKTRWRPSQGENRHPSGAGGTGYRKNGRPSGGAFNGFHANRYRNSICKWGHFFFHTLALKRFGPWDHTWYSTFWICTVGGTRRFWLYAAAAAADAISSGFLFTPRAARMTNGNGVGTTAGRDSLRPGRFACEGTGRRVIVRPQMGSIGPATTKWAAKRNSQVQHYYSLQCGFGLESNACVRVRAYKDARSDYTANENQTDFYHARSRFGGGGDNNNNTDDGRRRRRDNIVKVRPHRGEPMPAMTGGAIGFTGR